MADVKSKGKRLNGFDIFLIVCVALVLLAAAAIFVLPRFFGDNQGAGENENVKIRYVLRIESIPNAALIDIQNGETVMENLTCDPLGTIVDEPTIFPSVTMGKNMQNGELFETKIPTQKTVELTVESDALRDTSNYEINEHEIVADTYISIRTKNFYGYALIENIEEVEAE